MTSNLHFSQPPAIVIGLCGHGLSVIHALAEERIPVVALETNPQLPGTRTRQAYVEFVDDINGVGLIASLQCLAQRLVCPGKPVLFLTNDRMSLTIATHWDSIAPYYQLSWSHCRESVLTLLNKNNLESRCQKQGLNYPPTFLINSESDIDNAITITGKPAIVKPTKPLAGFKTALPQQRDDYSRLIKQNPSDLPFITQRFIPGEDTCIYFCALYLDHGNVLARFDGRKLRSRPMGHSTIAEPCVNEEVYRQTIRFFEGLQLSGPVSVEFKKDENHQYWVIEPTIGRTDFWVGLCTANRVNIPSAEYLNQVNLPCKPSQQSDIAVWFNEERDPLGRLWLAVHPTERLGNRRATYLFLHRQDLLPGLRFVRIATQSVFFRAISRATKEISRLINFISRHTTTVFRNKKTSTFQQIGISEGCFYLLSTALKKVTDNRVRLTRYHFVAQPVTSVCDDNLRPSKKSSVELFDRDNPKVSSFPRPKDVIQNRFNNGHLCFVAKIADEFSGFLWIAHDRYEEDEIRCCYHLLLPKTSVWDFDVYVEPKYRHGRTLARLWNAANAFLIREGIEWSISRISSSNFESLRSHSRLGIRRLFSATFVSIGRFQIMFSRMKPFIHVSFSEQSSPVLFLVPPEEPN